MKLYENLKEGLKIVEDGIELTNSQLFFIGALSLALFGRFTLALNGSYSNTSPVSGGNTLHSGLCHERN
jgi:hypothetical protein